MRDSVRVCEREREKERKREREKESVCVYVYVYVYVCVCVCLQKRTIIWRNLLIVAIPYIYIMYNIAHSRKSKW